MLSPASTLSPSFSEEDTLWLSSGGATPDRFFKSFQSPEPLLHALEENSRPCKEDKKTILESLSFIQNQQQNQTYSNLRSRPNNDTSQLVCCALGIENNNCNNNTNIAYRDQGRYLQHNSPQYTQSPEKSHPHTSHHSVPHPRRRRHRQHRYGDEEQRKMQDQASQKDSEKSFYDGSSNTCNGGDTFSRPHSLLVQRLQEKAESQQQPIQQQQQQQQHLEVESVESENLSYRRQEEDCNGKSIRRRCVSECDMETYSSGVSPTSQRLFNSANSTKGTLAVRRLSCSGRLEMSQSHVSATTLVVQGLQPTSSSDEVQSGHGHRSTSHGNLSGYKAKGSHLTISTHFTAEDQLQDTGMSSVSDAGGDRRASISSTISDLSTTLSQTYLNPSPRFPTRTGRALLNTKGVSRKGGPPVHYTLMCWIGGRWPCKLRPLIKKSNLSDILATLRRNLRLPPSYFIDIEFEWEGQTFMIFDCAHWQWAREQVEHGDMSIRCNIWQKRYT
ncbi:hypothetical protein BGZ94_005296, partial [Podila epigama]